MNCQQLLNEYIEILNTNSKRSYDDLNIELHRSYIYDLNECWDAKQLSKYDRFRLLMALKNTVDKLK